MNSSKRNEAAVQLWEQMFAQMAVAEDAAVIDPGIDDKADEARLRSGLTEAGWSPSEIEERVQLNKETMASAPVTSPRVASHVEVFLNRLCDDVEAAMDRLKLDSHARVARGVEPRIGALASMTNVIMTDQGIVTVGSFLFRFCGLVGRAFTRTLQMNPWLWESQDYSEATMRKLLETNPTLVIYWLRIFLSYSVTGTHVLVPYRPANKSELVLFEQVARAMEIFAVAHEYGHHHHSHGRQLDDDAKREEFEADQFALRTCYEVERNPLIFPNPYISSGAGGVILLLALKTLEKFREVITTERIKFSNTHPTVTQRLARFDSVAVLKPDEFSQLKGFRTASTRIMTGVDAVLSGLLHSIPPEALNHYRELAHD